MGRCTNNALISKIGVKKINKEMEVDFSVLTDVDRCMKVNAMNYLETTGTSAAYNAYRVPEDMFNCLAEGCRNSGTLTITGEAKSSVGAKYAVGYDATEFYAGVATYYVHLPVSGSYELTTTMSDMVDPSQKNADVYSQTIEAKGEGFQPVIVDFSKAPQSQSGDGWAASGKGAIINVDVKNNDDEVAAVAGISSFYFYDTIEDFEVNDVVKIGCIDELAGDLTVDPVDASCWGSGYDPTSISIERTLTAKSATPNYWKLNPLMSKGTKTDGWFIQGDEREILTTTVDGVEYGYVQFPDMQINECAFTTAAIADKCNVTDSTLNRVNTPVIVDLNEKQYIVLDGTTTELTDAGKILFHPSLVGLTVVVSYPKKAVVEQYLANDEALDERRVRMSFSTVQTDGVKHVYVYNNVLITSFPGTVNNEETSFEFTISIQRDRNGNFYEVSRIID